VTNLLLSSRLISGSSYEWVAALVTTHYLEENLPGSFRSSVSLHCLVRRLAEVQEHSLLERLHRHRS
jgi:hypothetical protein